MAPSKKGTLMTIPGHIVRTEAEYDALEQSYFAFQDGGQVVDRKIAYVDSVVRVDEVVVDVPALGLFRQWLVLGDMPFLSFDADELNTPGEALGIYAWFVDLWLRAIRGRAVGDIPEMLETGTWRVMKATPEYVSWLNPRLMNLRYWVIPALKAQIHHTEIRNRLKKLGVQLD